MVLYVAVTGFGALDGSVFAIGVLIAALLIASFVWGSRRKRRDRQPAPPSRSPAAPDRDSWSTPDEAARTRPPDRGSPPRGGPESDGEP